MELISIISHSIVILIATLVIVISLSYLGSVWYKRKNITKTETVQKTEVKSSDKPVSVQINEKQEKSKNIEQNVATRDQGCAKKELRKSKRKPRVKEKAHRYSVVNKKTTAKEIYTGCHYNLIDANNFSTNYEDNDEGVYYNIKIGA